MNIVPLTRERFIALEGHPPPVTIRGLALEQNGAVCGIIGLSVVAGENFIVSGVSKEISAKGVVKIFREFAAKYMADGRDYYALQDDVLPTSPGLLRHFGFVPVKNGIYIYRG